MSNTQNAPAIQRLRQVQLDVIANRPSAADRSKKGAETCAMIIAAAGEVFIEEGYAGLSIGKVAARADVRKGNITYYYGTKGALIEALLYEQLADLFEDNLRDMDSNGGSGAELLKRVITRYLKDARVNSRFFLQLWGYIASETGGQSVVSRIYNIAVKHFAALIRLARPRLKEKRAHEAALEVLSVVEGVTVLYGVALANSSTLRTIERRAIKRVEEIVNAA